MEGGELNLVIKSAQKKKLFSSLPRKQARLFGFTLIELLIVIAILGILAAAVLVAINPQKRTRQARDAGRKNDIGSLATELQAYYTTPGEGKYPINDGCGSAGGLTTLTVSGGLKQIPADPQTGRSYCYDVHSNTTEASVHATIEDPTTAGGGQSSHLWCWRSTTNTAVELAVGACTVE
ncbi:hypothetical protein A3A54_00255 [Candidatus Curtissbacteria bacterium RIFCSPLOWO2_01_FULL_39_62]|uniref:Type II secretion system protein GspG C-terminal domain-containing protein n=2 Tax=Candidatus Curtissiibacteriota TaxID=1752717 RepID=A0A1F5GAR3_9BACT|nr:MAG: hypothetical protein A3D04_02005 [Candidatus Curtissbacteria bacterium RIFCSPHIGHO2_02_FULL_40_16b]OGD90698.1 MAG: hypothetical protein A3E11_01000 [Candidatus Curtissbacteria bacterium RIFCSPHIGHO2_12_FULL_38_37]OGE00713.1 MAG: hypothetical protein A3J17_04130 [Candidatus Curtissbacteria bacterium RIFCSPLOWO2_02_FULL_40_11]OGE02447.1 MAG: hypothetical protein A3A54_00255 [Candidatus Curtissbacteria bacterium RIFCSPLOWO2_01_FULL_39_62]OGE12186.1 MAG: hypothetical protein A3G14_01305 [Ca